MGSGIIPISRAATAASAAVKGAVDIAKVINITSSIIKVSITAANAINSGITSKQAGDASETTGAAKNNAGPSPTPDGDEGWHNFYKKDLITYANSTGYCTTCTENQLGTLFEDIFLNYMTEEHGGGAAAHNFRRNNTLWDDDNDRNTVPDFTADAGYTKTWLWIPYKFIRVPEGSAFELKQSKRRGIYLSSNDYQIKGHINNLAARFSTQIADGFQPTFTLVTTYDVSWSPSISAYAAERNIQYFHRKLEYKIVNGVWKFRTSGILF
jgi:hypothetical protein